jgi:hypothetical protein
MTARGDGLLIAAGAVVPAESVGGEELSKLQDDHVLLASWERLGPALLANVEGRLWWVSAGIVAVVLLTLGFTFRSPVEVILTLATLSGGGLLLLTVMSLAGWSWNLMNLMAVPLLLGATVDYSIHMQLSLRRHGGDARAAFNATGKAVLLCAATTTAGFGSLALSSNAGLASLGRVCAVGALGAAITACLILPQWWRVFASQNWRRETIPKASGTEVAKAEDQSSRPSRLYGAAGWKLGMAAVRLLPLSVARWLGSRAAMLYGTIAGVRRNVVIANLTPVFSGDPAPARRSADRLFEIFGIKIVDLLRYESGCPVDHLFNRLPSPDEFALPSKSGRGSLLLTIHLGNWEFGAPLLRRIGVQLLVITLAEPGQALTRLREEARQRWNVETLVIGQDAFAFVEVLKRLQEGAVIALLVF